LNPCFKEWHASTARVSDIIPLSNHQSCLSSHLVFFNATLCDQSRRQAFINDNSCYRRKMQKIQPRNKNYLQDLKCAMIFLPMMMDMIGNSPLLHQEKFNCKKIANAITISISSILSIGTGSSFMDSRNICEQSAYILIHVVHGRKCGQLWYDILPRFD